MKTNKSKPLRVGSARSRARKFLTNTLFNKQSPSMIIHIHYSIYFTLNQMKLICSLFSLFLIIIHSQHCVLYSALCLSLLRCCCCCWCCLAATLGCALAALCQAAAADAAPSFFFGGRGGIQFRKSVNRFVRVDQPFTWHAHPFARRLSHQNYLSLG